MEVPAEAVIESLAQRCAKLTYENAVLQAQIAQLQATPIEATEDDASTA